MTHLELIDHKPPRKTARLAQGNKTNKRMRRYISVMMAVQVDKPKRMGCGT